MTLGPCIIVSSSSLGRTIYGCYVETIDGTTYSFFRNRSLTNSDQIDHFETTDVVWGEVTWKGEGGKPDVGPNIRWMSIPFYNAGGKALKGASLYNQVIDKDSEQSFRWGTKINSSSDWKISKVFNFHNRPTDWKAPFYGENTTTYSNHTISVTDTTITIDSTTYSSTTCNPQLICYVRKSKDATWKKTVNVYWRLTGPSKTSTPSAGMSYMYNTDGGSYEQPHANNYISLSGNDHGSGTYNLTTIHIYRVKSGANFTCNIYTDWDNIANVEEVISSDPEYKIYADLIGTTSKSSTITIDNSSGWLNTLHWSDSDLVGHSVKYYANIYIANTIKINKDTSDTVWTGKLEFWITWNLSTVAGDPGAWGSWGGYNHALTTVSGGRRCYLGMWTTIESNGSPGLWKKGIVMHCMGDGNYYDESITGYTTYPYNAKPEKYTDYNVTPNTYGGAGVIGQVEDSNYVWCTIWKV